MHVFHWMDLCVGFSDWSGLSSPHNKLRLTGDQLEATCHREQLALQRFAAFTQSLTKPQARNKFQANTESLKVATTAHGTGSKQHLIWLTTLNSAYGILSRLPKFSKQQLQHFGLFWWVWDGRVSVRLNPRWSTIHYPWQGGPNAFNSLEEHLP